MARTILTDQIWHQMQPLLPPESGYWGRPSKSHRQVVEGILWILRTGAPWRDLPQEYGPWSSCYNRFNRWTAKGIWNDLWQTLKEEIDHENYAIDGSYIKAHQDSCRVKKKKTSA
jgi:transposase